MLDILIAESTECDFKAALETKKPKSWLKTVSAFANGVGGSLVFGIDNNRNIIGLSDVQTDSELIGRLITEKITPVPNFVLTPEKKDGKNLLILTVVSGRSTPIIINPTGLPRLISAPATRPYPRQAIF